MKVGEVVSIDLEDFEVQQVGDFPIMKLKDDVRLKCSSAEIVLYKNRVLVNKMGDIGEIKPLETGE